MTMTTTDQRHELLTVPELADYLRVSVRRAYQLAVDGDVPAVKVGGQWRISRAEVERRFTADSGRESAP
jgi:excisionase family DNA binding protein